MVVSSMDERELRDLLPGGDRRSIGKVDVVLSRIKVSPSSLDPLLRLIRDIDPLVGMRAADALEKASRANPEILVRHKHCLLGEIAENPQQEIRWHFCRCCPVCG